MRAEGLAATAALLFAAAAAQAQVPPFHFISWPTAQVLVVPSKSLSTLSAKPDGLPVTPGQGTPWLKTDCGAGLSSCRAPKTE